MELLETRIVLARLWLTEMYAIEDWVLSLFLYLSGKITKGPSESGKILPVYMFAVRHEVNHSRNFLKGFPEVQ